MYVELDAAELDAIDFIHAVHHILFRYFFYTRFLNVILASVYANTIAEHCTRTHAPVKPCTQAYSVLKDVASDCTNSGLKASSIFRESISILIQRVTGGTATEDMFDTLLNILVGERGRRDMKKLMLDHGNVGSNLDLWSQDLLKEVPFYSSYNHQRDTLLLLATLHGSAHRLKLTSSLDSIHWTDDARAVYVDRNFAQNGDASTLLMLNSFARSAPQPEDGTGTSPASTVFPITSLTINAIDDEGGEQIALGSAAGSAYNLAYFVFEEAEDQVRVMAVKDGSNDGFNAPISTDNITAFSTDAATGGPSVAITKLMLEIEKPQTHDGLEFSTITITVPEEESDMFKKFCKCMGFFEYADGDGDGDADAAEQHQDQDQHQHQHQQHEEENSYIDSYCDSAAQAQPPLPAKRTERVLESTTPIERTSGTFVVATPKATAAAGVASAEAADNEASPPPSQPAKKSLMSPYKKKTSANAASKKKTAAATRKQLETNESAAAGPAKGAPIRRRIRRQAKSSTSNEDKLAVDDGAKESKEQKERGRKVQAKAAAPKMMTEDDLFKFADGAEKEEVPSSKAKKPKKSMNMSLKKAKATKAKKSAAKAKVEREAAIISDSDFDTNSDCEVGGSIFPGPPRPSRAAAVAAEEAVAKQMLADVEASDMEHDGSISNGEDDAGDDSNDDDFTRVKKSTRSKGASSMPKKSISSTKKQSAAAAGRRGATKQAAKKKSAAAEPKTPKASNRRSSAARNPTTPQFSPIPGLRHKKGLQPSKRTASKRAQAQAAKLALEQKEGAAAVSAADTAAVSKKAQKKKKAKAKPKVSGDPTTSPSQDVEEDELDRLNALTTALPSPSPSNESSNSHVNDDDIEDFSANNNEFDIEADADAAGDNTFSPIIEAESEDDDEEDEEAAWTTAKSVNRRASRSANRRAATKPTDAAQKRKAPTSQKQTKKKAKGSAKPAAAAKVAPLTPETASSAFKDEIELDDIFSAEEDDDEHDSNDDTDDEDDDDDDELEEAIVYRKGGASKLKTARGGGGSSGAARGGGGRSAGKKKASRLASVAGKASELIKELFADAGAKFEKWDALLEKDEQKSSDKTSALLQTAEMQSTKLETAVLKYSQNVTSIETKIQAASKSTKSLKNAADKYRIAVSNLDRKTHASIESGMKSVTANIADLKKSFSKSAAKSKSKNKSAKKNDEMTRILAQYAKPIGSGRY